MRVLIVAVAISLSWAAPASAAKLTDPDDANLCDVKSVAASKVAKGKKLRHRITFYAEEHSPSATPIELCFQGGSTQVGGALQVSGRNAFWLVQQLPQPGNSAGRGFLFSAPSEGRGGGRRFSIDIRQNGVDTVTVTFRRANLAPKLRRYGVSVRTQSKYGPFIDRTTKLVHELG